MIVCNWPDLEIPNCTLNWFLRTTWSYSLMVTDELFMYLLVLDKVSSIIRVACTEELPLVSYHLSQYIHCSFMNKIIQLIQLIIYNLNEVPRTMLCSANFFPTSTFWQKFRSRVKKIFPSIPRSSQKNMGAKERR